MVNLLLELLGNIETHDMLERATDVESAGLP